MLLCMSVAALGERAGQDLGDHLAPLPTVAHELAQPGGRGFVVAALPVDQQGALVAARASAVVADAIARPRPSPAFAQTSQGRWHCTAGKMDTASLLAFEELELLFLPCVQEFFAAESQAFYRSQLQLVNAAPGAEAQFFHQDNSSRGLTVVVPLVQQTLELGPTQMLAGTQRLTNSESTSKSLAGRIRTCFASVQVAQPSLSIGTALFFDSRVVHRGLPNASVGLDRPVLIYRYDLASSPPPGHTVASTAAVRLLGRVLHAWALIKNGHQ